MAERILAIGRDSGIPIVENRELVSALLELELDQEIPAELYTVVAEVLGWVLQLRDTVNKAQ